MIKSVPFPDTEAEMRFTHSALCELTMQQGIALNRVFDAVQEPHTLRKIVLAGLEGHRRKVNPKAEKWTDEKVAELLDERAHHENADVVVKALCFGVFGSADPPAPDVEADEGSDPTPGE